MLLLVPEPPLLQLLKLKMFFSVPAPWPGRNLVLSTWMSCLSNLHVLAQPPDLNLPATIPSVKSMLIWHRGEGSWDSLTQAPRTASRLVMPISLLSNGQGTESSTVSVPHTLCALEYHSYQNSPTFPHPLSRPSMAYSALSANLYKTKK
ncbi:Krueppel-Like Factor 14 [Manis pentadactyla]|nr:Krueppel-Like Factor 14 [Manis pentadactyla]